MLAALTVERSCMHVHRIMQILNSVLKCKESYDAQMDVAIRPVFADSVTNNQLESVTVYSYKR